MMDNVKTDIGQQRPDIARLSAEKLSYIANKGLVKRASFALEQGDTPNLTIEADLTLIATFIDNTTVKWTTANAIYESICSCPASTHILCHHQIQTALAYRHYYCQHYDPASLDSPPAQLIDSTHIKALINNTNKTAVQTLSKSGITITLSFTEQDPCAMARLPMATVHFWGGNALQECTCDCQKKLGCEHIILAAIAFAKQATAITTPLTVFVSKADIGSILNSKPARLKTSEAKTAAKSKDKLNKENNNKENNVKKNSNKENKDKEKSLNPKSSLTIEAATFTAASFIQACQSVMPSKPSASETSQTASEHNKTLKTSLMPALLTQTLALLTENERRLFTQFYRYGISDGTDATATLIEDISQENKQKKYLWLGDILQALKDWLSAYQARRSDFDLSLGNQLISEYLLRRIAGQHPTLASASLGIGVAAQTDIRPTQLLGLGCQIDVYEGHYQAQTLFLDKKTQTPLLLHSSWQAAMTDNTAPNPQANPLSNPILQHYDNARLHRITAKLSLLDIQRGFLSTQRGRRAANHSIILNKSRHAYNQWMPYSLNKDDIQALPQPLYFTSIKALREYYQTRPLSFARARYQQPNFVILPIGGCLFKGYDAAYQSVGMLIKTPQSAQNVANTQEQAQETDSPYWIKLNYRSHAPFALALLADSFADDKNLPHHVSGTLSWERFGAHILPVITPWALFSEAFGETHKVILALDLPKDKQVINKKEALASYNWQNSKALARLPLVDFAKNNSEASAQPSIHSVLAACQSWLDEALIYGAQSLPNSFWRTQKQLISAARQVGLQQLASGLTYDKNGDTAIEHYLLILVLQLAVMTEIAAIP